MPKNKKNKKSMSNPQNNATRTRSRSTSPSSKPSDKERAAGILIARGFNFNRSQTIALLEANNVTDFNLALEAFVDVIESITGRKGHRPPAEQVLKRFMVVMENEYKFEENFMDDLFQALLDVLVDFWEVTEETNVATSKSSTGKQKSSAKIQEAAGAITSSMVMLQVATSVSLRRSIEKVFNLTTTTVFLETARQT
jgi:hypothetical protein